MRDAVAFVNVREPGTRIRVHWRVATARLIRRTVREKIQRLAEMVGSLYSVVWLKTIRHATKAVQNDKDSGIFRSSIRTHQGVSLMDRWTTIPSQPSALRVHASMC
jgi:hypothetical protein